MMALSTSTKAGPLDLEHHVFHGMLCMVEVQSGSRGRTLCPSSCSRKECPTFSFLDVVNVWCNLPDACVSSFMVARSIFSYFFLHQVHSSRIFIWCLVVVDNFGHIPNL